MIAFRLAALALVLSAAPAAAHTGHAAAGFTAGFAHPWLGADHLIAMAGIGVWAAMLGGRARLIVPAVFIATMAAGAGLAWSGAAMPAVETGIAGSLVLLGLLIAGPWALPAWLPPVMAACFAFLHGHAHGTEMPEAAAPAFYALGFLVATALSILAGAAFAAAARHVAGAAAPRLGGLVIVMAGLVLAV